jgi:hypothetical protein
MNVVRIGRRKKTVFLFFDKHIYICRAEVTLLAEV